MKYTIGGDRSPQVFTNLTVKLTEIANGDDKYDVTIKPYKRNLTQSQRNYWHKCVSILGDHCGYTKPEMKALIKEEVLGLIEFTTRKGETKFRLPSTEELKRNEYAKLIDETQKIAISMNVILPQPEEY